MDSRSYKFPLMPRLQGNIYLRWVTPEVALGISELNNYLRPQAAQQDPDSWGYFLLCLIGALSLAYFSIVLIYKNMF